MLLEASQAEESIFDHIFVHFLHKLLVVYRLLEVSLVDPIESTKASLVQVLDIDLTYTCRTESLQLVFLLLLPDEGLLLFWTDRVNVKAFVHVLLGSYESLFEVLLALLKGFQLVFESSLHGRQV